MDILKVIIKIFGTWKRHLIYLIINGFFTKLLGYIIIIKNDYFLS